MVGPSPSIRSLNRIPGLASGAVPCPPPHGPFQSPARRDERDVLVVLGLVWPQLRLHALLLRAAYWLALVGTYLNWAVTLAAAAWGAGGTTMPLAAGGHLGTPDQELTLLVGLRALNVAMFASCFLVLWGLRGEGPPRPGSRSPC